MSVPLQSIERTRDIAAVMADLGRAARAVARTLALASTRQKNEALRAMARALRAETETLLKANAEDVAEARAAKMSSAFVDRLLLDPARIDTMARGIEVVAGLDDPVGQITDSWTRPNGMTIERVRVPLGVIGIIYESRQCDDPAWRFGQSALEPRDRRRARPGLARSRPAGDRHPAGADARPRGGRHDACRARRQYRRACAPRRQGTGGARPGRGTGPRVRAP